MLGAIARTAAELCEANDGLIFLVDGDHHRLVARHGTIAHPEPLGTRRPIRRDTPLGRALIDHQAVHIKDLAVGVRREFQGVEDLLRQVRVRSVLAVPMLRDDAAIGGIVIRRTRLRPFTPKQIALLKTFAEQAAIAIENARLSAELASRNRELTEALEQQTATAEILHVITSSPTDIQPVLAAVAESAARLCDSPDVSMFRVDPNRDALELAVHRGPIPSLAPLGTETVSLDRGSVVGRSVIERRTIEVADLTAETEEYPEGSARARRFGFRTTLSVPLVRDDVAIGAIVVRRSEARAFSERQIAILKTFAGQAVIAIENFRLFHELQERNHALTEALEQQTATSEILRVISRSPTDIEPVFSAILTNAVRLCGAVYGIVWRYDADMVHVGAVHNLPAAEEKDLRARYPCAFTEAGDVHRIMRLGRLLDVPDVEQAAELPPVLRANWQRRNVRSGIIVPMQRDADVVGAIGLSHRDVGAFSASRIELLKTFADQAVIAIENARLFKALQERNGALSQALEQQTASAEILQTISRSHTDVQPVFQAIVDSATRLLGGHSAVLSRIVDDRIELAAYTHTGGVGDAVLESFFPVPLHPSGSDTRPIREGVIGQRISYNVADVETDPRVGERGRASARARGYRSQLVVPMLRDNEPMGTLAVTRREAGAFGDEEVALLQTFADQAVIAIENARLFNELQARNAALAEALEQQTATSEILRVISSSPTDVQPVLDAVAEAAARLCSANDAIIRRVDGDMLRLWAHHGDIPVPQRDIPLTPGLAIGRAILEKRTVHVDDVSTVQSPSDEHVDLRAFLQRVVRARTVLATPLIRDDVAIGVILIRRMEPRAFSVKQVQLLETFADQAVIAIENVRLFNELQSRTQELTLSVGQLTALGEVGRAVSSTLDLETLLTTIASRARELTATDTCTVYEYDEAREEFHVRATQNVDERVVELTRIRPIRKGEGAMGRVAETHAPVQIEDIAQEAAYQGPLRQALLEAGVRAVLAVPLLREERLIGVFIVTRKTRGRFADEVVALLQTFATQSAIAIHNARLYRELEAKSRELEAASRHKSQFLANMSHELRTPMNAILGYTELIADGIYGGVPDSMREVLGRVDASGRHLLGLINDVLDLSKIEAGQLTLTLADYSMKEVVEAVVASVEALAAEKKLRLVVDLAPHLPVGHGDQRRLAQVLLNLVGNAMKFTEQGQIAIRVGAAAGLFTVAVSDTGPGIAPADQERIFEEFQQADTSTTRPKGGTGLGLAIARRIVAMHGGRIWVESALGEGATFRFTMPIRIDEAVVVGTARS